MADATGREPVDLFVRVQVSLSPPVRIKSMTGHYQTYRVNNPYTARETGRKLKLVRNHILLLNTEPTSTTMKEFLEEELGFYKKGMGYYRLWRKRELIQPGKNIALVDNKTGMAFIGAEVREMLGLPSEEEKFHILPYYDPTDYTIYVQSTAPSRKIYFRDTVLAIIEE